MYTERGGNSRWRNALKVLEGYRVKRGMIFGAIIVGALLAFELFNYTTTDFALTDLLGDIRFLGLRWAMILSLAFCGMDFAGIARLFTPEKGRGDRLEVWYLLGAWFLAATMNAMLTWWGVSIALLNHTSLGNEILSRQQLLAGVPVFVAVLVWLIRVLIIGTFSLSGDRLFSQAEDSLRRAEAERLRPVTSAFVRAKQASPLPARPVRTIGDEEDEDYDQRPQPVEARRVMPVPPARPSSPSVPVVRPAPKPSVSAPAYPGGSAGVRPAVNRGSEAGGRPLADNH